MTLNKCSSYVEFVSRRWLRLFPAMLIATLFIYLSSGFFHERPAGIPTLSGALPGVTFIKPETWSYFLGHAIEPLEGSFWTIYVEVSFYLVFGLIYFLFGEKRALLAMFVFCLAATLRVQLHSPTLLYIVQFFNLKFSCWFLVGSLTFVWQKEKKYQWLITIAIVGLLAPPLIANETWGLAGWIAAYLSIIVFLISFNVQFVQKLLVSRLLVFIGFISYPLYLIHENMMISMIIKFSVWFPLIPHLLLPAVPFAQLILVAWIIATYCEPKLRKAIVGASQKLNRLLFPKTNLAEKR